MSYLQFPRLAFSGLFQADVSTVNNDPRHFDNATFNPAFQTPQQGSTFNGWWNPMGSGIFALKDCLVKSVMTPQGEEQDNASQDGAIGLIVGNALNRPSGKMVDLDPDWQLASSIYGQGITLCNASGEVLFAGEYEANAFRDLWFSRTSGESADSAASAMFQSILTDVQWNAAAIAASNSAVLQALMQISQGQNNTLSIRLTTYGFDATLGDPYFSYGVLLGAIGPAYADEPHSFILGRRFMPYGNGGATNGNNPNINTNGTNIPPSTPAITCFSSVVTGNTLQVDLSNAMPLYYDPSQTSLPNQFRVSSMGENMVFALLNDANAQQNTVIEKSAYIKLAALDYSQSRQLAGSGIQSVPLPAAALAACANQPFALLNVLDASGDAFIVVREGAGGLEIRSDQITFRLDPNDATQNQVQSTVYVAQYGQPLAGQEVVFCPTGPLPDNGDTPTDSPPQTTPKAAVPVNNQPVGAISCSASGPSDAKGKIQITLQGPASFGAPRAYMDGQLYMISYNLAGQQTTVQQQFDVLAVLLFSSFSAPNPVTWEVVQPILQQYANLYPVMSQGLFDFSQQAQADANAFILRFVFDKPIDDPDQMPVTRDLSSSKRAALIQYFDQVLQAQGRPASMLQMFNQRCPTRGGGARAACPHSGGAQAVPPRKA
ncbi:hypothetical protein V8J88_04805 [Massilia sp. W12]|uniref:hypothetical protein n=1 Tax=Massilia sp. W12 TaxID=3126507 RepID=UPI0030D0DF83